MKTPKWFARFVIGLLALLLILALASCRAKKTVTKYEVKEEIETKILNEVFTGSEVEKEITTKKTEEISGGTLIGTVPVDLEKDSTVIKASSDGVDLNITIKDGTVSYTVDSKTKGKITEETTEKTSEKDTTAELSSEEEKSSLEERGSTKEVKKPFWKSPFSWVLFLVLLALAYKYRKKLRSFIP